MSNFRSDRLTSFAQLFQASHRQPLNIYPKCLVRLASRSGGTILAPCPSEQLLAGMVKVMANRILILDDEEPILLMLKRHFSSYSFEVDTARQEGIARRLLEKNSYSVVIVDLGLTRLDRTLGLDLIGLIRKRTPGTGIIVYTGNQDPGVEELARQLGADYFVLKPVPLSDLDRIVFSLCGLELAVIRQWRSRSR